MKRKEGEGLSEGMDNKWEQACDRQLAFSHEAESS